MKFVDVPSLARLNTFLDHLDVGDYVVDGDLETYSCKLAGLDKKLSKSLDQDVQLGSSPLELSRSPVGPLSDSSSRKTLIYLILTLNHIYPDYDFSQLRAHHFRKEAGIAIAEQAIDSHLLEVSRAWENTPAGGEASFLDTLWLAFNEAIQLKDCDVYSYKSEGDADPFGEKGSLWSFNFFLYNRKLKRMLYFSCRAISKTKAADSKESSSAYHSLSHNDPHVNDEDELDSRYGMAKAMDEI